MIISMTGYGKAVCELKQKKITIELKSLNSKQLDLNTSAQPIQKELEIRNDINNNLFRGKVDVCFYVDSAVSEKQAQINSPVIETYYNQLLPLAQKFGQRGQNRFSTHHPAPARLHQGGASRFGRNRMDKHQKVAQRGHEAGSSNSARKRFGFEADFRKRIKIIDDLLNDVTPFEKERIEKLRARLRENLETLIDKSKIDENRLEQEFIFTSRRFGCY